MKSALLLSSIFFFGFSYSSYSQEYSYTHYDISDGLAGSVVYCITQDKDGFIWTGTETGVSRFDGTHFKTFTEADGLPDIEVLEIFGDSHGRVWMAPFKKSICYYYQGKIHNQDNDSLLGKIYLRDNVENFAEDAGGNVLIVEKTALQLIRADGSLEQIDSIGGRPVRNAAAVSRSPSGQFLVQVGQEIYTFSGHGSSLYCPIPIVDASPLFVAMNSGGVIWRMDPSHSAIRSFVSNQTIIRPFVKINYAHYGFSCVGDSLFYYNELAGSLEYNVHTGKTKRFLPGKQVSRTFRDATGNMWFTTMGQGLYRLNSDEFRTIRVSYPDANIVAVHTIRRIGDKLLVGDNHSYINEFTLPDVTDVKRKSLGGPAKNRLLFVGTLPNGHNYWASDGWMEEEMPGTNSGRIFVTGIKYVLEKNVYEVLISCYWGACLFDLRTFRIKDTLWRERSTTLYFRKDTVFIGTLNGLYAIAPDHSATYLGKSIPFFQKRISAIAGSSDGTLWIASYDAGVIGYRDGRVIATLSRETGLTSNICRTLLIRQNSLWVGTDKGLNHVALDRPSYPITQYTSNDGLGSNMINTIYEDGSIIYVGTSDGLSYFDQSKVNATERCSLYLLSILNAGKDRLVDSAHLLIPYQDKHVRLEFAGISYRSVGEIAYRYRLLGLDTGWQQTKETFLDYPTLPSGKYTFQLQAINKFGIKSRTLSMRLEVATPFHQTAWFYVLIFAFSLLLTWLFVDLRIKRIRRRQREKERLNQRFVELENRALQSQMNPHFIFNCLNSIQQYIFAHETLAANKYLTEFARLIRATLHNSSKTFISLADEIDYLSTYLSLEKLRFKEKMDYSIEVDPSIDTNQYLIPPMLVQPYIENSIRHGLRNKTSGTGNVRVMMQQQGGRLIVIIEDNGIGREKARKYKTAEHIEYQSKGMSMTANRLNIISSVYGGNPGVSVEDIIGDNGECAGTRVVINLPGF